MMTIGCPIIKQESTGSDNDDDFDDSDDDNDDDYDGRCEHDDGQR